MQCMTDYLTLSQHFLSPWTLDVCEVWGLRSDTWADGQPHCGLWVCAPLASGCFLRLAVGTTLPQWHLGAPLPTSRALWGVPLPQGSVPTTLTFLGSLDSHSVLSPWLWGSLLLLGPYLLQHPADSLRTDAGRSGPHSCSPLRPDAPRCLMPRSWEPSCWCFCSCCFPWEGGN